MRPDGAYPSQGRIENGVHVFPVRVYYEDTDAGGVVYYANYLKFAERARTELLRMIGYAHSDMIRRDGLSFAVRRCEADYLKPAIFDDTLEVHTGNIDMEAASLWMDQGIRRDGIELASLRIRLACLADGGRPVRLPEGLKSSLKQFSLATAGALSSGTGPKEKERV